MITHLLKWFIRPGVWLAFGLAVGFALNSFRTIAAETTTPVSSTASARDYHFDKTISRPVLENYLSRSISMEGMFNGRGDLDDNIRMLTSVGAKYIGRSLCLWGAETDFLRKLERARAEAPRMLAADPEVMLEACCLRRSARRWSRSPSRAGCSPTWASRWSNGISASMA